MSEREGERRRRRLFELSVGEDVDRELRFHMDMRAKELEAEGWDAAAARAEAARLFGDVRELGEECRGLERRQRRSRRRARFFDAVRQDLRYGARTLARTPLFAAMAVLTLALGMGANTAIFSVVNGVLLRPLPYPEPGELVILWELTADGRENHVSTPNLRDWQEQSRSFAGIAAHPSARFWSRQTVLGGSEAAHVRVASVTQDFFPVLGVPAATGRAFGSEDHRLGASPAVVVSDGFWRSWLGGDPELGRHVLQMDNRAYQVVGVMPAGFDYPSGSDAWVPAELWDDRSGRTSHNWMVIARLREGTTLAAARAEMSALGARLKAQHGEETDAASVGVVPLDQELVGALRRPLYLLLGAAGLVLLIACTNLASGLLARGASRQAEVAVRSSLGASRGRIIGQMLIEALLLSVTGAAVGLVLGAIVIRALVALAPSGLPRIDEVGLGVSVLLFTVVASVGTAVLFGLYPALRASAVTAGDALRGAGRGNTGDARGTWWGMLVAFEVALALLLLVGSGLLMRSFWRVLQIDPGFDSSGVLTAELSLPDARYQDETRVAAFYQGLLQELARVPGVESAGIINHLPLAGFSINGSFDIEGRTPDEGYADYRIASGGYFASMGIPLLEGRTFEEADEAGVPDVVIINQAAARRFWPDESPLGKRIRNLANDNHRYGERWLTVIGVVGDVRHGSLTGSPRPETYVHYLQRPARASSAVLTVRGAVPPASLAGAVRALVTRLDHDVPAELAVMDSRIAHSVSERRFTMLVLGAFAGLALLLASVGIYGVVSYAVARRTREIGIRLALGVEPRRVRWLMQRQTLTMVLLGAAAGMAGALALTGVLRNLLFDVSPTDPLVFAGVVLVLLGVAWLASYLPARRTTRVDPMIVLRSE